MLPQGPATRIIVPPNVEILAFLASFRAMLAVFWVVFAPLGPFGALWALSGPFGPFWSFFDPWSLVISSPLVASSRVQSDLVSSFQGNYVGLCGTALVIFSIFWRAFLGHFLTIFGHFWIILDHFLTHEKLIF